MKEASFSISKTKKVQFTFLFYLTFNSEYCTGLNGRCWTRVQVRNWAFCKHMKLFFFKFRLFSPLRISYRSSDQYILKL